MSQAEKNSNIKNSDLETKNKKRPANSPLSEGVADCTGIYRTDNDNSLKGTFNIGYSNGQCTFKRKKKRVIRNTVSSSLSDYPDMSFTHQNPFPVQSTSPTHYGFPMPPMLSMTTPPWATEILDEVKQLKSKLKTMENIEKTVNMINSKVGNLESKFKTLEIRVSDTEKACEYQSNAYEANMVEMKSTKDELKNLKRKCDSLESSSKYLVGEKEKIESKLDEMESRSMRVNLLFYGVTEEEHENCTSRVKNVCKDILGMPEADTYLIERAQRIGKKGSKPRPILVSYHYFAEREAVRLKSYDKSGELRAAGVGIGIQLPKAIRDARKPLYDVMENAKKAGKTVRFVGKNLFINGKLYKPEGMEH
ncbi:uncharacterized protein LOC132722497 [Ruditapes philippinarum]|uniref:uncharacterized protein LOC132722497 n=1 Tax=Ruditapes philippinarum TaxID=129788 RepID=UPI00295AC931|nr:uncharacterized protein LOC132722497 [Ruditapes philippinarum]